VTGSTDGTPEQAPVESARAATNNWTPELTMQLIKEIITATLAFAIVGFAIWMAVRTWLLAGDATKLGDAKDVLQLLLGPAGVVVGYYFGRVPADARAAIAQREANAATADAQDVKTRSSELADRIDEALAEDSAVRGVGIEPSATASLRRTQAELRALARRPGRTS
jgi:hypothetical protein